MGPYEVCPHCGVGIPKGQRSKHQCDPVRRRQFQEAQRELQIAKAVAEAADGLDEELTGYLDSNEARFFEYLASKG